MVLSHYKVKILVVCGPSGAGKSTLLKKLFAEFPNQFGFSVSHTTRSPRQGEVNGYHYHFTTFEEMQKAIDAGKFLEYTTYAGNMYGTSVESVRKVASEGKICVLDIETQGVRQMKARSEEIEAVYTFVMTPTLEELENRLRARGTETEDSIAQRLKFAADEIPYGTEDNNFDLVIVNEKLTDSYRCFKDFVVKKFNIS